MIMNAVRILIKKTTSIFRTKKSGTIRTMFPVVLGFALVLGASTITSTNSSYVRLETSDKTVLAGDRFSLDIYAFAHVPVNAVDITLRFDKNDVAVLAVDRGESVLTIWTEDPIIEEDKVILRGGTFRRGFLGEHKVATIDLRAKETGQSEFSASDILLLAGDGAGSQVKVSQNDQSEVSLFIYDENTDPNDLAVDVEVSILTDLDGDGRVTLKDISAFMGAWSSRSATYDFNGDGRMSFRDFSIILANFFFQ